MLKVSEMDDAAKRIEVDGVDAFHTVSHLYGEEVALILVVAHVRRSLGSMEQYPPDPRISKDMEGIIKELLD